MFGYSKNIQEDFLKILMCIGIKAIADMSAFPGSCKSPHFRVMRFSNGWERRVCIIVISLFLVAGGWPIFVQSGI